MLFNSYTFLVFFAIVLLLHHAPFSWSTKKFNLLIASYVFYAAWNPPFVVLVWISTVIDWFAAKAIARSTDRRARVGFLALSLLTNLGLLSFFKYGDFLLENFVTAAAAIGVVYRPPSYDIVLPVGISFYTFQTLSYTIDVFRRQLEPSTSFRDFALYVTFFPQLVAGPIVRASDFLPQTAPGYPRRRNLGWGLSLLVMGLFEKVVLADGFLAPEVERLYDRLDIVQPDTLTAWCGTLAFAGQIFCDFAGYSTCAIGVAMCLGFALPDNFRFPYAAIGFSDFWRRWHISLSTWLRDYLYVPLGGNRKGHVRMYVNLMVTMLLGGLWHGAAWTFVAWGGLHGLYLAIERWLRTSPLADWPIWRRPAGQALAMSATFVGVCFAWVFFRADSFAEGFSIAAAMAGFASPVPTITSGQRNLLFGVGPVFLIIASHVWLRSSTLEDAVSRLPASVWGIALAAMMLAIVMMPGENRAFIYFQF